MVKHNRIDWVVLICSAVLIVVGFLMILSTTSIVGARNYADSYFFIKKHSIYIVLGLIAFTIGLMVNHRLYKRFLGAGLLASFLLMVGTFIPGIGVTVGGATRWINVGIQIQPVEIMKFFVVVFVANYLETKQPKLHLFGKGMLPLLLFLMLPILLLAKQPDLGNILVIMGVSFALIFLSRVPLAHFMAIISSGIALVVLNIVTHPYQLQRIKTFLFPWDDPLGKSYHIIQSFIAIGSGGLFGLGLGQGKLKYSYLPLHYSDFIFSIVCEEGGLILSSSIIVLFGILFWRGTQIARYSGSLFSFYLALGLTLFIVVQALLNIGVVIGVFPVTGIPLTFISYGGTSLIMSMFFVGVLLNISKTQSQDNPQ